MCIVFVYSGVHTNSDYSLIIAANRDESYDRPSKNADFWSKDHEVIGGLDLQAGCDGGTWLALSPVRKRIGILLNLPGNTKQGLKSRGKIVKDFVTQDISVDGYIDSIRSYGKETNHFNFVIAEFGHSNPSINTYSNATDRLEVHSDTCLGFSNSLSEAPLKKVEVGKEMFRDICSRLSKETEKNQLVEELTKFLKCNERHLPDPEIQRRNPKNYEALSSIYVCIPEFSYGTRTHTIILVTKSGQVVFVELTMKEPIDPLSPEWIKSEFKFDIKKSES